EATKQLDKTFVMEREPRLSSTRYFEYLCTPDMKYVHDYFKNRKASAWCIQSYIEYISETGMELDFVQCCNLFTDSLTQINKLVATPSPIRAFCNNYLAWLKSNAGVAITRTCAEFFETNKAHKRLVSIHGTTEDVICLNAKTDILQAHLQSESIPPILPSAPKTPPQTCMDLSPLKSTPNKRSYEKEELQLFIQDVSIVCASGQTFEELSSKIEEELAVEVSSMRDTNPAVWTPALEKYLDAIFEETMDNFQTKVQTKLSGDGDERFRLYCEKVLIDFYYLVDVDPKMSRKIGEQKHIVYQVSSLFKYYERTFLNLEFDWIELQVRAAKVMKSSTNSGIVEKHTLDDSKKTLQTDILNLIAILRDHLDCEVKLAAKIRVFSTQSINNRLTLYALSMLPDGRFLVTELATATIPFSFNARSQYKAVLRMMAIFHDEVIKQEALMEKINRSVLRTKETKVRDVLRIPELE
ncbi:11358_t:CDS:2, partial [Paraglomus occultum]